MGFTVLVHKRILNKVYASIWISANEDQPSHREINGIIDTLQGKFNAELVELREIVYILNSDPVNLSNFC